jgi:hypothetical protein
METEECPWSLERVDSHKTTEGKNLSINPTELVILESQENKQGVDQWMITWPYSNKVRLLFPNIGRSLVGKFLNITSTRNAGSAVNIFPLEDLFPLSPKDNDS